MAVDVESPHVLVGPPAFLIVFVVERKPRYVLANLRVTVVRHFRRGRCCVILEWRGRAVVAAGVFREFSIVGPTRIFT